MHRRQRPLENQFTFPYYFYVFDLDELDDINTSVKIFNHKKWNILSIHDKDYLISGAPDARMEFLALSY